MNIKELADKKVSDADGNKLDESKVQEMQSLFKEWQVDDTGRLVTNFEVDNFLNALDLANAIGELAEAEGHHPDLFLHDYKYLLVMLISHEAGGLTEKDFVLAAKIENLIQMSQQQNNS